MEKRGSLTVFAALTFMLIASFLTALLEAGRMYELEAYADISSALAVESVCAEYQPVLWEDFHMLGLDGAYGGENFSMDYVTAVLLQRIRTNLNQGGNGSAVMALSPAMAETVEYQLLTDGDGSVFLDCVADYMKENLSVEAAQILYDRYTRSEEAEQEQQEMTGSVENAKAAIEDAKRQQEEAASGNETDVSTAPREPDRVEENPLDVVLALKQNALLGMVTGDLGGISTKRVALTDTVGSRKCERGTAAVTAETDWYDKVLALEYMDQYFSDYGDPVGEHALSYEMEYVLCGEEADGDNLEGAVNRLLLIREAANITHILGDSGKMATTLSMAEVLAGFTGNPAIIKVVQIGIVAAWAYVESILDIRALLAGKKIALFKSSGEWTTSLGNLVQAFSDGNGAKECADGISYQDYIKGLLFTMRTEKLAYRMMDVMEWNIRLTPTYANCRMDHMLCGIRYRISYTAEPLFSKISMLGSSGIGELVFENEKKFAYYE